MQRVTSNHVSGSPLILIAELGLGEPSWEESDRWFDSFLRVNLVNVVRYLRVVDEGEPRFEALLDELVFFLGLGKVWRVEKLCIVSVIVLVTLDLLEAASVRHHDHVEVA